MRQGQNCLVAHESLGFRRARELRREIAYLNSRQCYYRRRWLDLDVKKQCLKNKLVNGDFFGD